MEWSGGSVKGASEVCDPGWRRAINDDDDDEGPNCLGGVTQLRRGSRMAAPVTDCDFIRLSVWRSWTEGRELVSCGWWGGQLKLEGGQVLNSFEESNCFII